MKNVKKFLAAIVSVILIVSCLIACDTSDGKKGTEKNDLKAPYLADLEKERIAEMTGKFISREIIDGFECSIYEKGIQIDGFAEGKELTKAVIPGEYKDKIVIGIGDEAFYHNEIENIDMPETVKYIGRSAFAYCDKLQLDAVPRDVSHIGSRAFIYCKKITSVKFEQNIEYLGEYIFASAGISEICLPDGLKRIPTGMFFDTQIEDVNIPEYVDCIGENAFARCNLVENLTIPGNVTTVETKAFYYNQNLKTVVIQEGLLTLPYGVFGGCISLEEVTLPDSVEIYDASIFSESSKNFVIYCNEGSKADEFATNKKYSMEYIQK